MNEYRIDILVKHKTPHEYEVSFSFPLKAHNKEEARESISRNDVQSVILGTLPQDIKKTILIHISFNNRLIYEIEQKI